VNNVLLRWARVKHSKYLTNLLAVTGVVVIGIIPLLGAHAALAVSGAAQLSLPWAGEQNGTMGGGPHNFNGLDDPSHSSSSIQPANRPAVRDLDSKASK
jgi:hypothetical protein